MYLRPMESHFADEQGTHSPREKVLSSAHARPGRSSGDSPSGAQTPNRSLVLHWDGHLRHQRQCLRVCTFPCQHRRASCASLRGTHKSNKENIQ